MTTEEHIAERIKEELQNQMAAERAHLRRARVQWFLAGYKAGMADDPKQANALGGTFTLDQRMNIAVANHAKKEIESQERSKSTPR